jgi:hypothetical protein
MTLSASLEADVCLVKDGKADSMIVSNGHRKEAEELQKYLKKISGADVQISDKAGASGGGSEIVLDIVGQVPGASSKATARQAYRLKAAGKTLTITAATERGLLYGVYGLLSDHLGVKFYTPAYEVVPQTPTVAIKDMDDLQEPAFQFRGYVYYPGLNLAWHHKVRGGGLPQDALVANHTFYNYISPDKYFKAHPEWFPLIDGKRVTDDAMVLCATNPELARELGRRMVEEYDKFAKGDNSKEVFLQVGQGDGFMPCKCPTCRELVHKEESEAAPFITMLNVALDSAAKERLS